jgi:membrane-associated phospholipid phosphatase
MNCVAYYGGMLAFGIFPVHNWTTPLDTCIPLSPLWAIVYVMSFAFWVINYVMISRDHEEMVFRLVSADMIGKIISLLFFVFLPTTLNQPSLAGCGAEAFVLRIIYHADKPVNLFPSLHCLVSWLCFRALLNCRRVPKWYKIFSFFFCFLVFFSTLYTKQHVVLDVFGGWILAELCYDIAPHTPLPRWLQKLNLRLHREPEAVPAGALSGNE